MQLKIEYKKLPKSILFIYTEIFNTKYGIINDELMPDDIELMREVCSYLYNSDADNRIIHTEYDPNETKKFKDYLDSNETLKKDFLSSTHKKIYAYFKRKDELLA